MERKTKMKPHLTFLTILFLMLGFSIILTAKTEGDFKGSITGRVIDQETRKPLSDVSVKIPGTNLRCGTNENGEFMFDSLSYGTYLLQAGIVGYEAVTKSDLVVSSTKPLQVVIELIPDNISTDVIDVEASYFQKNSDENTSVTDFDYEEIRRAPGASQDISRMMQSAPGVSVGNDQRNDLIIRGGSPNENLIIIDGIEIPNINHFGSESTSGGAIGFLNLSFIRNAKIYTGGFPSKFGDKLSGVVDINFRDASKKNFYNNIDLSFAGFGGIFEGPITNNSSYMLSIRRSYLDLLKSAIRLTALPKYWDFNLKLDWEPDKNNRFSLIGFSALDKINFNSSDAKSVDDLPYNTDSHTDTYTAGMNYQRLFKNGYFQAVLSNSFTKYKTDVNDSADTKKIFNTDSYENESTLKLESFYKISRSVSVDLGIGGKYDNYKTKMYSEADTTPTGYPIAEFNIDNRLKTAKFFAYANLTNKFFNDKLIVNTGVRYDYFNYTNYNNMVSPRIALTYNIFRNTSINAAYGIFYQTPSAYWLSTGSNKDLKNIRCDHFIAGVEQFITPDIKVIAETYHKKYIDYPVSAADPTYILIDAGSNFGPNFYGNAITGGYGYVNGIDLSIEKKLSGDGFYGMITYSYSRSRFKALAGDEKQSSFDPTNQLTVTAGYNIKDNWLIGIKFKYMGRRPYTPFDVEKSIQAGRGVYDMNNYNGALYPDYGRLDIRMDKKFYIGKVSLTTYFELQNVLNKTNVYEYFWNKNRNEIGTIYHWAFMPVGGFNIEF